LVREQIRRFLQSHRPVIAAADLDLAAADLLVLVRALFDAAAQRQGDDLLALEDRLVRALIGYLT
jgi:hypothetical protein